MWTEGTFFFHHWLLIICSRPYCFKYIAILCLDKHRKDDFSFRIWTFLLIYCDQVDKMQDLMLDLSGITLFFICCGFNNLQRGNVWDCGCSLSLTYIKSQCIFILLGFGQELHFGIYFFFLLAWTCCHKHWIIWRHKASGVSEDHSLLPHNIQAFRPLYLGCWEKKD